MIAVTFECTKLSGPVDGAPAHGGPLISLAIQLFHHVLAMTVANPILWQETISIGVRFLIICRCVPGIPIQHQMRRLHCAEDFSRFSSCCSVACQLIFQDQDHTLLACFVGRVHQLLIDGRTIGRLILEAPEIKEADAVGTECPRQFDTPLEHFILLLKSKVSVELITLGAVFGFGRARPIHLEQRTGDVGDAQIVLFQNTPCFLDFFCVQIQQVFVPHAPQFDPIHAKFSGGHLASVAEVLRHLVADNSNSERRLHTVTPSFSSRYFLLITADSLGVRPGSGTASSSTMAQPRKFDLCNASNTAGKSIFPRPSSTKRYERLASASSASRSTSFMCRKSSRSLYFSIALAGSPPPWK